MSALLTIPLILLAYAGGRYHQARVERRHWLDYGAWLKEQRERLRARFGPLRVVE